MASKNGDRKRNALLKPWDWVRRSRSPSPAASEHSSAASLTTNALLTEVHMGLSKNSLPSHASASSICHRSSTSPLASQSSEIGSTIPLSGPLPALESQSVSPSTRLPCSESPPPLPEPSTASDVLEPLPTGPLDLWSRALLEANNATRKWLQEQGLHPQSSDSVQPKDQIKELIGLMESKKLSVQNDEPLKIEIGNRKIVIREYIADAVAFITMVGDAAIVLATPQVSAPWAVTKAVMKIPVKQVEQMASLFGTVQWFTRIVRRGQVYEALYTAESTDERAVSNLHNVLLELYIAAIELLAKLDGLVQSGVARQTLTAILNPDYATDLVSALYEKEQKLDREVQSCEASRSALVSKQMTDGIEALKKQLSQLSSPLPRIDKSVTSLLERINKRELEELMNIISSEAFGKSHAAVTDARIEATGDWLLTNENLCAWQDIPSSSAVFLLKGAGGTGKTYLTSKVVDHVKQTLEASQHDEGFAFSYCNRSGSLMQEPLVVLRSFVRQLSGKAFDDSGKIQSSLIQRCAEAKKEGRELSYKDCKELILESLNLYSKTTIILDALDESDTTMYNLAEILCQMMEKSTRPVKIFISSRPDREYLEEAFGDRFLITVDAGNQHDDIEKFLVDKLYSTKKFKQRKQEIQDKIKDVFKTRSCGMFRWVCLQVKSLERCVSDDAIHSWTRKLPRDLTEAYDQLWENVKEHDEHDVALAERAIMWVLCSIKPLGVEVLLEAIQYTIEGSTVVRKGKQTQQQILSLCQDLLTIDEKRGVWMLPHASVAEYFESKGWTNGKCDAFASKISLGVLENFQPEGAPLPYGKHVENHTFEKYVEDHWFEHVGRYDKWLGSVKEVDADAELVAVLKRFLGSPANSSDNSRYWVQAYAHHRYNLDLEPSRMALFAMCKFGFYYTLRDWWQDGNISEEMALEHTSEGFGRNSLVLAARSNCMPICKHLVGVIDAKNPAAEKHYRAVMNAILYENIDIAKFLVVEVKADANALLIGSSITAAQAAATSDPELLQWLVDLRGKIESVRILLKAGADVNAVVKSSWRGSALVAAATQHGDNRKKIMQLLLDSGADPNLPLRGSSQYGSALEALVARSVASFWPGLRGVTYADDQEDAKEMLQMLLDAGASSTAVFDGGDHGSALAGAACYGQKNFLKMMIDRVGRDCAIDALRQSRRPYKRYFFDEQDVKRWKDTATYLAEEVGVSQDILHRIGLWDIEPSRTTQGIMDKFVIIYQE